MKIHWRYQRYYAYSNRPDERAAVSCVVVPERDGDNPTEEESGGPGGDGGDGRDVVQAELL